MTLTQLDNLRKQSSERHLAVVLNIESLVREKIYHSDLRIIDAAEASISSTLRGSLQDAYQWGYGYSLDASIYNLIGEIVHDVASWQAWYDSKEQYAS